MYGHKRRMESRNIRHNSSLHDVAEIHRIILNRGERDSGDYRRDGDHEVGAS